MTGFVQLSFAALKTEHLTQLALIVCSLAVSSGYFKTYYYFSTRKQHDQMNFKIVSSLEIPYRLRSIVVGARSNGGSGKITR